MNVSADRVKVAPVREVVAVFADATALRAAIDDLLAANFSRDELGLVASEATVKQSLGDLYVKINQGADDPKAPVTDLAADEEDDGTLQGFFGNLGFIGAAAAGGAVVATAGILGGAIAVATAGVAAVGTVGLVMAAVIGQTEAEHIEQEISEGNMLLFVRTLDPDLEKRAMDILAQHTAVDIRVYSLDDSGAEGTTAD